MRNAGNNMITRDLPTGEGGQARMEEIESRLNEVKEMLDDDEKRGNVKFSELEEEVRDLNEEKKEIEERQRLNQEAQGLNNGSIRGKTIESFSVASGTTTQGNTFIQRGEQNYMDDGAEVLTRNQNLSEIHPNHDNLNLGKYLRGAVTGNWNGAEKEQHEFRALSTATSSVLIPQVLSSKVVDLARNQSVLFQAGVPLLPMESNNMTISRIKSDPNFSFKAEGASAEQSTMEFEPVDLKSKTVYGVMSVTLEALESSANLQHIVTQAMSEATAQAIDKACLFGDGNNEPLGILNSDDINVREETEGLEGYSPFIKAVGDVRKANGDPTSMVINADTDEHLNMLVDQQGNPLATPKVVENLERHISNQLSSKDGEGENESTALVYDPQAVLIGMQSPIRIEVSREAKDAFEKGLVYIRVYAMLDIATLKPKHITKVTGLKEATPEA